jgi:hypothetical protein
VIEDFERPAVFFGTVGDGDERVTLTYRTACSATELELDDSGTLTVRYRMVTPEECKCKLMRLPKERREYFDVHHGYLDMSSLGINEVRLLAC